MRKLNARAKAKMVKSPSLMISRWITLPIYLVTFILCAEVNCQTVFINESDIGRVSPCSSGLRDGMDFYLIKGIVNATVAKYSNLVDFQIKAASSNIFQYLCTASLVTCITPNPQPCYCAERNGNIYEIVANRSAVFADSNAMIRIQWDSSSGDNAVSNAVRVPEIYNNVTTSLNDISPLTTPTCPKTLNNGSEITYRCLNYPSPCEVAIAVNNIVVAKGEVSVTYTVSSSQASNSTENFKFSYSVCGGPVIATTCLVTIEDDFTTTPASTTAVTNGTTTMTTTSTASITNSTTTALVKTEPGSDSQLTAWQIALICLGAFIGAAAIVVALFFFSKYYQISKQHTGPNRDSAAITPPSNVSAQNTRTPEKSKIKNVQNASTLPNGNNWKGKTDDTYELQEEAKIKLPNTPDELKKDEAVNNVKRESENKNGKKQKTNKKNKDTKEQEKESSSTNRNLPLPRSGDKKLPPIHSQAPTGTKLNNINPYG